jgi:Uma2 family endonuclease
MSAAHASRIGEYWGVPDLAVEIISPTSAFKDREIKRREYAKAGIAEYWIIDLAEKAVEILQEADSGDYRRSLQLANAEVLSSRLFEGFSLPLTELFAEP